MPMRTFGWIILLFGFGIGSSLANATDAMLEQAELALSAGNYDEALPLFRALAADGNADAMLALSIMNSKGLGVPESKEHATTWALKAKDVWDKQAATGDPAAYAALGLLYRNGRGVLPSAITARRYFLRARRSARPKAEQGDALAQYVLGRLYLEGLGVKQDTETALQWFAESGHNHFRKAQRTVAHLYECNCRGVTADPVQARYWNEKLAMEGVPILPPGTSAAPNRLTAPPVAPDKATPIFAQPGAGQ